MNGLHSKVFLFGPFRMDAAQRALSREGQAVPLTPKEFDTLLVLVENNGELVGKEAIVSRVWPDTFVADSSLTRNISVLRKALGEDVIETLPKFGYRLALPVRRLPEANSAPSSPTAATNLVPAQQSVSVGRFRGMAVALIVALAIATAAVTGLRQIRRPQTQSSPPAWVLIVPFENRTGGLVPDGVSEYTVQRELNRSRYAKVAPAERVREMLALMRQPVTTVLTPDIAREVCLRDGDIQLLISGRAEKLNATYVLTSDLVDPRTGVTLRSISEKAEGENQLLPAVRKLAERTGQAVDDQLPQVSARPNELEKVTTRSLHALELYSSANEMLAENYGASPPAVDLLREAVALDPQFLSAQALLTHALANLGRGRETRPYLQGLFELADTLPDHERYFVLGSYYEGLHQPDKAAEQYEALLRLYPDHFWGVNSLAELYRNDLQRPDAAIPYYIRRADLRPSDFVYNDQAWQLLTDLRKQPETAERYRARAEKLATPQVIERFPWESIDLLLAPANRFVIEAKPAAALGELQRLGQLWESLGPSGRAALANRQAFVYAALGRIKDAKGWFARAAEGMAHDWVGANIADAEGDNRALLYYLLRLDARGETEAEAAEYLARLHQVTAAQRLLRKLEKQPGFPAADDHWIRGALARARGDVQQAKTELEAAVNAFMISDDSRLRGHLVLASEALADLREAQGDTAGAIAVLEPLSSLKLDTYGQFPEFARVLVKLSRLYQQAQRFQDSQEVNSQLRARFAVADTDYFVIRYLRGERTPAERGPELASVN